MPAALAYGRSQGSGRSWQQPLSQPSATELPSARDATLLRGLDWCHGSTPPAGKRSFLVSINTATFTPPTLSPPPPPLPPPPSHPTPPPPPPPPPHPPPTL